MNGKKNIEDCVVRLGCVSNVCPFRIYQSDTYGRVANEVTEPPGLNEVESSKIKAMNL